MSRIKFYKRFEVFTAVKTQFQVFRVVTPCGVMVGHHRFRGLCCLHLQGEVKMALAWTSDTVLFYHNTTEHHNPEDLNFKIYNIQKFTKIFLYLLKFSFVNGPACVNVDV
jgi:hypothetical protein